MPRKDMYYARILPKGSSVPAGSIAPNLSFTYTDSETIITNNGLELYRMRGHVNPGDYQFVVAGL